MKLTALRALVATIQEGSMRGAARRVGVSQPALTKLVRELEIELGAPLLVRTSKGVEPTAQGKVLFDHALRVSKELVAAAEQIQQLGGQMRGDLNVAAVPVAVMLLIPETLRTFCREFPEIRMRVSEELFIEQLQRLRNGEVHIALSGIPEGLSSGEFVTEKLIETEMVVVVRKGSRHERTRRLEQLADARWVYTNVATDTGYAARLFESHGMPAPPVGAVVNSTLTLMSLVATGDYVGLMPRQAVDHPLVAALVSRVPLAEAGVRLTIGAIVRSDVAVSPAIRHFIVHLHRAARHVTSGYSG